MALVVNLKYLCGVHGRGVRLAKLSFRGSYHYSKLVENVDENVIFEEVFEWPVARPIESHETLEIHFLNYNKYFNNRLIGTYGLVLQRLVDDGHLKITDSLLDSNNMPMKTSVALELRYSPPDGSISSLQGAGPDYQCFDDDQQALLDVEQNIANLERSLASREIVSPPSKSPTHQRTRSGSLSSSRSFDRKRITMKAITSMMRIGKQRPQPDDYERLSQRDPEANAEFERPGSRTRYYSTDEESEKTGDESESLDHSHSSGRRIRSQHSTTLTALKAQDFQVCVTVIEARQLAGLNMDPVVCVQVGDNKKYTSVKESTNCPYYNEYFVFDFHMAPAMLYDKMIKLTVYHSRKILRAGTVVGSFKLDVKTVYDAPDHQFYHKWAVLTDPDDITAGPRGYLKCDISVIGRGDSVKIPPKSEKDEDDIEANLLLPDGVPAERQRARIIVRVYRADGLPRMNAGIMANVKKAFTGEVKDLVDPYVQVSFAGMTGKTSVKKNCYQPVWNEQVAFTEMFPPLCQRIKIQLRDNDSVNDPVIGTHFIELAKISNEGEKGFLPTFGPAFVYLYGSTRDYSLFDEHTNLNDGLGEGVSYRGRLLIAVRTEILDSLDIGGSEVEIEPTLPIVENVYGRYEEFFLFGAVMEASMIDQKLGTRPITFELSIGNAGNTLDGNSDSGKPEDEEGSGEDSGPESVTSEGPKWQSTTPPVKPHSTDRYYYYLPYMDRKPCMYIRTIFQDHRRRIYNSNIILKIVEKLEESLETIQGLIADENPLAEKKLRTVIDDLSNGCARYITIVSGVGGGVAAGKTKLDKERIRLCHREIDHINNMAKSLKPTINKASLKDRFKVVQNYCQRLKLLIEEPQDALPDVFIWMLIGGKRVAYHRIPARHLIFSIVEEECGRDCGRLQTVCLKLPGKRGHGSSGWAIQAKLTMYLWLGLSKHKKSCLKNVPRGYEISPEVRNMDKFQAVPPTLLHYREKHYFQLRAHMYQARSLIGSDASGLSDPFARVVIAEYSQTTQVLEETLSPTWDEMLLFPEVVVYGNREDIKADPPTIVIEIFDMDKVGKSEFIGRALAKPHVKMNDEPYASPNFPPCLQWYTLERGPDQAGELLATFELLQMPDVNDGEDLPSLPQPKESILPAEHGPIFPVPPSIRPILAKYRIEVLFWGLRDLRRVHLMSVDRPRVDIECAGHVLQSSVIQNYRKNPNFSIVVKHFDVELPEQALYCPPLTIRVVDCRSFGRYTLVGTHIINSLHKFLYTPMTKREREAEERKRSIQQLGLTDKSPSNIASEVTSPQDNRYASSPEDSVITIESGGGITKLEKTEANLKTKAGIEEPDDDEESKDWWTKYFASVEALIEEGKEARENENNEGLENGSILSLVTSFLKSRHQQKLSTWTYCFVYFIP